MVDHCNPVVHINDMATFSETFQEQLYLANVLKEFFHLQLLEQQEEQTDIDQRCPQLDEIRVLTPHSDVLERNKSLEAELCQCRLELDAAIKEKVEVQNLLHNVKEDDVEYSEVVQLKMKLEESEKNLSRLYGELANCKALLEASQGENEKLLKSLASVTEQKNKFEEVAEQYDCRSLSSDFTDSSAQLAALQLEFTNLKTILASLDDEKKKFKEENEFLVHEKETLLGDLADCKIAVASLEQEIADLNMNIRLMAEERDKMKEHEEFLNEEIRRLSAELVIFQDKKSIHYQEQLQLEADLKEAMSHLEQLTEENIILQSNLEVHKAKLAEVVSHEVEPSSQAGRVGARSKSHDSTVDIDSSLRISVRDQTGTVVSSSGPTCDDTFETTGLSQLLLDLHDSASGVAGIKVYLKEAQKMLQKLENAVDEMHAQSVSLSRSAGKAAGVSKLIQAFESKSLVDGNGLEETPSPGSLFPSDIYTSSKEQFNQLRTVLKALTQNVEHVNALIMEEKDSYNTAVAAHGELEVEIETLKGFNNDLELRNIELEVLWGAMSQYPHNIEAKKTHLFDALEGQEVQLNELRRSVAEIALVISNEVETLQREMKEGIYAVDRQWKSTIVELVPMVEKFDAIVASAVSYPHHENSNDLDVFGHFPLSISNPCEVIEQLKMRLDFAGKDHEALSNSYMEVKEKLHGLIEEHNMAVGLLQKFSGNLAHFLNVSGKDVDHVHIQTRESNPLEPLDASYYEALLEKVGCLLDDWMQLKESHGKLYSDLLNRTNEIQELNKKVIDGDVLLKIIMDVKDALKLQDTVIDPDEVPVVHLQSFVLLLTQKYKEAEERASRLSNDFNSRLIEFDGLQGHVDWLEVSNFQQQNEVLVLRESLTQAKDAFDAMHTELLEKAKELDLSEQRIASIREKLSIAVAKGKGLVVHRDSLKRSVSEMSRELEKRSQELRLKNSRLHEMEERLKAYSEAGERMEALESELSYIRNSATALRESFLLKDSTLLRIEEILEDLELPEQFHTKDITEKVDWLAKSVAANSLTPADWDQRSSVGGGSYSDTGFVADGGKEDTQNTSNPVDDLRRKYDELQTKFYELAEQNEMLEQSLMERNILVQRWEEILDRINTPPQIRSMEPEERIHWLGTALSEADHHMRSLQQKVESLENYCRSLSVDLEESQRRMSDHESSFRTVLLEKESALSEVEDSLKSLEGKKFNLENYCESLSTDLEESRGRITELESLLRDVNHDKETLSSDLVTMTSDRERLLDMVAQYEQEVDRLAKEVDSLQKKLVQKLGNEERIQWIEDETRRLQHLILDVLPISGTENILSDENNIQNLEMLIRRLVNHIKGIDAESCEPNKAVQEQSVLLVKDMENHHSPDKPVVNLDEPISRSPVCEGQDVADLRKELASSLDEIVNLREERDAHMQKNQSLSSEIEALERKMKEAEELLNQEEQKSASLREKLNLAVRKGKSLVQQRDSMKQNIEEMTAEIDRLKSKINNQEHALLESAQKINDLSSLMEQYKAFENENLSLKSRLMEAEPHLEQTGHTLNMLLSKLSEIDAGDEINALDPLQKLEGIGKLCSDLHAAAASFQHEANKSKKAAELLLAELNEVQERNDSLQEEIARTYDEISSLSKERDLAESAKAEALSHIGKLSEERKNQLAEFERLNFSVTEVKNGFFEISTLICDLFAKNKELLQSVSFQAESCLEHIGVESSGAKDYDDLVSVISRFKDFWSTNLLWDDKLPNHLGENVGLDICMAVGLHFQQLAEAIGAFKDTIHSYSVSLDRETEQLTTVISTVLKSIISQKDSFEPIKGQCSRLESTVKEKDMEGAVLRRSISFLYDACLGSITEIESRKSQLVGEALAARDLRVNLPALPSADGVSFSGITLSSSENCVKTLADELLLAVKDYVNIVTEIVEGRSKEMRSTILNLQKELQEKDIQREQICMELVSQIKEAETSASSYSRELQSMKNYAQELEIKLEATGKEQTLLEQRVAELLQGHSSSIELEEKVKSLNGNVAAKEQEIEALMQALDEEENQMETLRSRVEELEKVVEERSIDLERVEASRSKAVKKLAVTVSKFDELHHMSEGLLSEVENLQCQLQDRDAEISFLRQEVTRCTNDVLEATKKVKERSSSELLEFLKWLDAMFSSVRINDAHVCFDGAIHDHEFKERVQKDIVAIVSELGDLRVAAQKKDTLLQAERNKVEDLSHRKEALEVSLREKELHLKSLQAAGDSGLENSEIVEVEPVLNKRTLPVNTSVSQVRSLRKVNNDQVSIAIDTDAGNADRYEDEEDDKVHGFKSLTTSRFVPKFTRPVSDMIDGLWVSCDRALMRQPAFRLGIMIYWAVLHALLASLVV